MFLYISQHILHVCVVHSIVVYSVAVRSCRELHVDQRLVRKVLVLFVELWRSVWALADQIAVAQALVVVVRVLAHVYFVQFRANCCISVTTMHLLTIEDVTALSSGTGLSSCEVLTDLVALVYLLNHLHLVWVVYYEFLRHHCSSICCYSTTGYNLWLTCSCWNFIIVLL